MTQNEFLKIVIPLKDKVFRLSKRLLISREEAEDATQEVIAKLWYKKDELKKYNSIEALTITMTKNYCLDRLKSKQASNLQLVHSNYTSREAGLDKTTEDRDHLRWIEKIINELPETQKMVVQLREIEELEFEEIAKIMETSPENIRVILSRARKRIREEIEKINNYGITKY
jgi:RNA polymerase sigma factor (sigma-70 family)